MLRKVAIVGTFGILCLGKIPETRAQGGLLVSDMGVLIEMGMQHADMMEWMAHESGDPVLAVQARNLEEMLYKAEQVLRSAQHIRDMTAYVKNRDLMNAYRAATWGLYSIERAGVEHGVDSDRMREVYRIIRRTGLDEPLDDVARRERQRRRDEQRRRYEESRDPSDQALAADMRAREARLEGRAGYRSEEVAARAQALAALREETRLRREWIADTERQIAEAQRLDNPEAAANGISMLQNQLLLEQNEQRIEREEFGEMQEIAEQDEWNDAVTHMESVVEDYRSEVAARWRLAPSGAAAGSGPQ